jgi:hypothetical protein
VIRHCNHPSAYQSQAGEIDIDSADEKWYHGAKLAFTVSSVSTDAS